jgi:hypothetical protein
MSTTKKREDKNFTPFCSLLATRVTTSRFLARYQHGKRWWQQRERTNEQTKQRNIHVLARGNGHRSILEQSKRNKIWTKILAPWNTTSLGPRPSHLQELASSPKDVQTKDLTYSSTRDLYMKNWTLRVDLNPIKWTIVWPVDKE